LVVKEALSAIYLSGSPDTKEVLKYLLAHPGAQVRDIARQLHMAPPIVKESSKFIRASIRKVAG